MRGDTSILQESVGSIAVDTFSEVHVGDLIGCPRRITEVIDQLLHRRIAGCDEVDRLHRRQGFTLFVDVLYQGNTLGANIMHLAAR